MLKLYNIVLFFLIFLVGLPMADNILVTKDVPLTVNYGEPILVTISMTNELANSIEVIVRETVTAADVIEPALIYPKVNPNIKAALPPYLEWKLNLTPGGIQNVSYVMRITRVGYHSIGPTRVISGGETYYSKSTTTWVFCNTNQICEPNLGEDYANCPTDCESWSMDSKCNGIQDGVCDSDCASGYDSDCREEPLSSIFVLSGGICIAIFILLIVVLLSVFFFSRLAKPNSSTSRQKNQLRLDKRSLGK